jgi:hypothetical protein
VKTGKRAEGKEQQLQDRKRWKRKEEKFKYGEISKNRPAIKG